VSRRRRAGSLLTDFARDVLAVAGFSVLSGLAVIALFYLS